MTGRVTVRRVLCLTAACTMMATTSFTTAAQAAVGDGPGGLTLNPTSGSTSADPIAAYTSTGVCPTDFRDTMNVSIYIADPEQVVSLTGNITPTDNPPSGSLDEGDGLAKIMDGAGLSSGDYQIAQLCYQADTFAVHIAANTWIHVDLEAGTWHVITGGGGGGAVATTTTLNAQPATVDAGQPVTLTATVTGAGAAGSVEFLDGATSLGTAAVSGGTATKTVDSLAAGQHTLTAKFVPTDSGAFTSSTSGPVTVTVNSSGGGNGGGQGSQSVNVTVPSSGGSGGGSLTIEVGSSPVDLTPVSSGSLSFQGGLSPITVTDGRDQHPGWGVTGATTDFTGGGNTIDGKQLGWTPKVTTQNPAADVVAGSAVTPAGPGLKQAATLASAASGKGAGASTLGGTLDLEVPASTPAGAYSATLTVTLMSK